MRLDKFLSDSGLGSRKEVKQLLKQKCIKVNGTLAKDGKQQISQIDDYVTHAGEKIVYQKYFYYVLNKPKNVISSTKDPIERTVVDLLAKKHYRKDIFPVGRLDKDTEGLLLLTNDGDLAHQLLSPKKHVDKEYLAEIDGIVTEQDIKLFAKGFTLKNGEAVKPARLIIDQMDEGHQMTIVHLTIQEGKFHQVKRMFETIGKRVTYLKRLKMGSLSLDSDLPLGKYRPLTTVELAQLKQFKNEK